MTPTEWRRVRLILVLIVLALGLLTFRGVGLSTEISSRTFSALYPSQVVAALQFAQVIAALVALRWRRVGGAALLALGVTLLLVGTRAALAWRAVGPVPGAFMPGEWGLHLIGGVFSAFWPLLAGAALLLGPSRSGGAAQRLSDAS